MKTKKFELPNHPVKGKQQIVVERPSKFWELAFEFMGEHPILTFFIALFGFSAIAEIGKAIFRGFI